MGTPAGKAGFLTACYILLVPILGLFLKKKCGWNIWVGIGLTVVGLYLLCMTESLSFQASDLMVLLCALLFAIHILVIDYFSPLVDGVRMSCIQFLVCGVLCGYGAFRSGNAALDRESAEWFCLDCNFICGCSVLWRRIYPADCRTERTEPYGSVHAYESGICVLGDSRMADP